METKPAQNIQDSFLNNARRDKAPITIYLLSGVKLTGRIRSFDKYSVVLETSNSQEQLIFKHAISTVVTSSRSAQSHAGERSAHHAPPSPSAGASSAGPSAIGPTGTGTPAPAATRTGSSNEV